MVAIRGNDAPLFQPRFVSSFLFIIRKLKLVLCRFFIMHVTCIASSQAFEFAEEDEFAPMGNVKDLATDSHPLRVERVTFVILDLVEWLIRRSKSLINLEEM